MIPFSPPRMDQKIIDEVTDTLRSGWITTGPKTQRFEQNLADFTGAKAVVCLNSATAGLHLALWSFGIGEGDEVIVPAYTYCATANVVRHLGATPIMVDINEDGYGINFDEVAAKINEKTKAIMPVDVAGIPCNYDKLQKILSQNWSKIFVPNNDFQKQLGRPLVVVDAAHSLGSSYGDVKQGALFDMASFSFHAVKNLSTAEGGALAINLPDGFDSEALKKRIKTASLHGQSKDALNKLQPGAWEYDVEFAGFKCNMTDIQASMGLVELARYEDDTLVKRRELVENYKRLISEHSHWFKGINHFEANKASSYHLYLLQLSDELKKYRDQIILECASEVALNVHYKPLPLLKVYNDLGYELDDYPEAKKKFQGVISLPLFYDLTSEQQSTVINCIVKAIKKCIG